MANEGSLWVSISCFRLLPPQDAAGTSGTDLYRRYANEALPRIVPHLQDKGIVSSWVVRTAEDEVTYIGVYASEAAMQELWGWASQTDEVRDHFNSYLELIRHEGGPLTDVFRISSRWQFDDSQLYEK